MTDAQHWNQALSSTSATPDSLPPEAFLGRVRQRGVVYDERPLCAFRRPVFISHDLAVHYARLMGEFHQAIRFARAMIVDDGLDGRPDSLAVRIGVDPAAVALASINPGYVSAAVLSRVDTTCVDDHPWMIELNAEAPAGMAYGDALSDLFLADPLAHRGGPYTALRVTDAAVRGVVDTYHRAGGQREHPVVAIVDLRDVPTAPEFSLFKRHFELLGNPCHVCDPRDLDYDGHALSLNGQAIDVVYRRLLVSDILERPDACRALVNAYRDRRVVVVNSLRSALLHGKGLFAMLHDPMVLELLPDTAQNVVREHIAWTGILGDQPRIGTPADLRETVYKDNRNWVLKPMSGHGGEGVVLGWTVDLRTWQRALDAADNHVVQRRVPSRIEAFPDATDDYRLKDMQVSLDPYLVRGRLAGFLSRLSVHDLGNVALGGSQVPVLLPPDPLDAP